MAKHYKRGRVRMGSLSSGGFVGAAVPGLVGVGVVLGGTMAVRAFVRPTDSTMAKVFRYAPFIGGVLGVAASLGLGLAGANRSQQMATASSALAGALGIFAIERLNGSVPGAELALSPSPAAVPTAGLAALTAEIARPGMQGVVMEPMRGSFGETVNAGGGLRGAFNPDAFGRPQAAIG